MKNFGTVIDNFDAVTKQYVDNKVPTDEHIKGIKVDNATSADTAKKVKNAFTYKAHNKAAGTVVPITYDGSEAASLDFSADDFAYDYVSGKDIKVKLVDKGYATSVKVNDNTIASSGGVVDLGTVLKDASKFATSAQGTKADNAMPKDGGAFTGAVTVQAPTAEMNPTTKQYVDTAINAVKQFEYQVVTELPTASQATMGKIYLVAHSHNTSDGKPDSYDEFITVKSGSTYKWERIGNTDIDLSGYVPTTRKINNKALSSDITLYPTDVGVTEANFPGLNKTGTVTGVKMNEETKTPSSGVVDLGTVLTDESKFATSAQGTKADNAMPKSGGEFTGDISVPKTITFTDETNQFIKMRTGGTDFYFQSTSGQFGLGPTWDKATHWDSNGNVTFPIVPKVGNSSLALKSEIPTVVQSTGNSTSDVMSQNAITNELNKKANSADLATVATSGSYNDLNDKPTIPTKTSELTNDSNYATIAQVNAKYTKPESGIPKSDLAEDVKTSLGKADTALQQAPVTSVNGKTGAVQLGASDVGALPTSTKYVVSVNGESGEVKNIAKTNSANTFTGDQTVTGNGSVYGNFTVGGNLTVNGTTTTVDSTTLQVKDKLIEVAHGNTSTLTTPAGLVAPKYDGTNSGALVFDSTGTAYVGDVTLKDGNIDVANSGLQPLATRTGLVGGNLVQYDSSEQTLKDSGKKISDLATTSQVNAKYTKPSGGIPKTDLASSVQTSLDKADTALQSAPVTSVNGKTGAVTIDVPDISGKANLLGGNTFSGNQVITGYLDIRGTAAEKHLKTRGIGGSDGNGNSSDLYLQYSSNYKTYFGSTGNSSLNADGSVTIDGKTAATTDQIPDISGKLDKTKYEVNKTIEFGQDGALYIGKFKVYDTNVTFEITSTTSVTYSGKLVIAAQNYVISEAKVYGDAANTVTPNIYIKPSTTSDPYIEVYFKPESWSKNVVHIYGSNIQAEPTNVCTNEPSIPSTATFRPKNALPVFELSGTTLTITL